MESISQLAPNAIEEQKTLEKSIEIDKVPESETEKLKGVRVLGC